MAAPFVIPGEGTIFQIAIASTPTTVGQVHEIDGPNIQVKAIPNANLLSTAMTTRPSHLPTPEKMTIKLWQDINDATVQKIFRDRANVPGTIDDFTLKFNDGDTTASKATFSGFVTSYKTTGIKNEENVSADIEIQVTTIITYVVGVP